jgi:hypothetical protein
MQWMLLSHTTTLKKLGSLCFCLAAKAIVSGNLFKIEFKSLSTASPQLDPIIKLIAELQVGGSIGVKINIFCI